MKDQADKNTVDLFTDKLCPVCSAILSQSKTRHFIFCSVACKQSDYRCRKKALCIVSSSPKALRISNKPKIPPAIHAGVSGTVHHSEQNTPRQSVRVIPSKPAPIIKNFDDLAAFFSGV